jgi:hypothetical protein
MAPLSEVILTSSSSSSTASGSTTLHDFTTSLQLSTLKPSSPGPNSTAYIPTAYGQGGICATVMEGKPLMNVWAWQKVSSLAGTDGRRDRRRTGFSRTDLASLLSCSTIGAIASEDPPPREAHMLHHLPHLDLLRWRNADGPHLPLGGQSSVTDVSSRVGRQADLCTLCRI